MAITDLAMKAAPTDKDQWLIEGLGRGAGAFVGRITPNGARTFYFRYTDPHGKQVRLKIGEFATAGQNGYSVANARTLATRWSALYQGSIKDNIPPVRDLRGYLAQQVADKKAAEDSARVEAERDKQRQAEEAEQARLERERRITVRQLFARWAGTDLSPRKGADGRRVGRKDGGEYTRLQFERYVFPALGEVAAVDVRKADLMVILDAQKAAGKLRTANVLLTDLKQMFRFALTRDIVERNPLDTVIKSDVGGQETQRERVLSVDEIRALSVQMPAANMGKRSELAPWLILATACRISELMNARWEHVDMVGRRWHIPAANSKNQREHNVHLSDFALLHFQALDNLRERDKNGQLVPWVFPNRAADGPVDIKTFGKQLADRQRPAERRMMRRTANTEALTLPGGHWTAHDLRRTAATLMAGMGISSDVIDECLNHMIQGRVTRIYIRDRREVEQARAFDALGAKLQQIVSGAVASSNVVEIRRAA